MRCDKGETMRRTIRQTLRLLGAASLVLSACGGSSEERGS